MPQKRWNKAPQPLLNPPQLFEKRRAQSASAGPYEVPGLALVCQKCGAAVDRYDATGGAWCDACDVRCQLVNLGFYAGWPLRRQARITIPAGAPTWRGCAIGAPEAAIAALLGERKERAA